MDTNGKNREKKHCCCGTKVPFAEATSICQHITIAVLPNSPKTPQTPQTIYEENEDGEISNEDVFEKLEKSTLYKTHASEKNYNKQKILKNIAEGKPKESNFKKWYFRIKLLVMFSIWLGCSITLMSASEKTQEGHQISIPKNDVISYVLDNGPKAGKVKLVLEGAVLPPYYGNLSSHWVNIWVRVIETNIFPKEGSKLRESEIHEVIFVSDVWNIPTVSEKLIGIVPEVVVVKTFSIPENITNLIKAKNVTYIIEARIKTNLKNNLPIILGYNLDPINTEAGIIYAALVLLVLYFMIIFDVVHRTVAAMLSSTMSLAILAFFDARPTTSEIISWINGETLLLLFSMMTLVTIISETGIFDYLSVQAYRVTGGKIWPLVNSLCLVTAFLSCFLDSVTTALLITPVTIKLAEVLKLNPVPVLICMVVFSNIGGAITPIGDPPNVLIASNPNVIKAGVNFFTFTMHMGIGTLISLVIVYFQLRYFYRDTKHFKYSEPSEVKELRGEIAVWKRTTASVSSYSRDEDIVKESLRKRTACLLGKLQTTVNNVTTTEERNDDYKINLKDLEKEFPIKNKVLLFKSGCILLLVISVFFLHSIPILSRLGLGWTALLGALLLLLVYGGDDIEGILSRIEWSTLLFFASLFILMEALGRLGLIDWIGKQTQYVIMSVGPESRLAVAIILILWVSGIASAFVDNIPLTSMMIKIATDLSNNRELNLPLQPLVWALSFGACFGGNGSLFGSSSNIICAGVAEQHGYRFTFMDFFKIGFPITLTSMSVVTVYLLICHVLLDWV